MPKPRTEAEIGARMLAVREAAGMTQDAAAAIIGLARIPYSNRERGAATASAIEVHTFAVAFGKTIADFMAADFEPSRWPVVAETRSRCDALAAQAVADSKQKARDYQRDYKRRQRAAERNQ